MPSQTSQDTFKKDDGGKLQWHLVPFSLIKDTVKVLEFGAQKYGADNWQKCADPTRYKDALLRHVIAYTSGEEHDSDTGLSHLAHAMCNLLFLKWFDEQHSPNRNIITSCVA